MGPFQGTIHAVNFEFHSRMFSIIVWCRANLIGWIRGKIAENGINEI